MTENNLCKICGSKREKIFTKKILGKYDTSYFKCLNCGFIQTEKPYWLKESYSSAITSVDVSLVNRNIMYSNVVEDIIYEYFDPRKRFLDFAGGYGMFTRIMRDKGFDFYRSDKYCENLFAKYFDINDLSEKDRKFELVTAFEFMEHIEDPCQELRHIFSMANSFLFATELIPSKNIDDWWYLGTEHGQHISFYTKTSLEKIAQKYDKNFYTNGSALHVITNKENFKLFKKTDFWSQFIRALKTKYRPIKKMPPRTWQDFEMIVKKNKE